MCRILAFCFGALLWALALTSTEGHAAGAIYVSATGDAGWCTGQHGQTKARNCALEQCTKQSNGECQLALDCVRGWGAIAFGPSSGYAMLCEVTEEGAARAEVLLACVRAVKDKCETVDAFSERGATATKDENKAFDDIFYAQIMLAKLGYYGGTFDGDGGPTTQAAILKYQQETKGVPVSGKIDDATMASLLNAVGGNSGLVDVMMKINHTVDPTLGMKTWAGNAQPQAAKPATPATVPADSSKPTANPLQANAKAVVEAALNVQSFGLSNQEMDEQFNVAFTQIGFAKPDGPAICGKAAPEQPYSCLAKAVDSDGLNPSTLALDLFSNQAGANEVDLVKAKVAAADYVGSLYKTTNSYSFQRKDAKTAQNYEGTCYQTLGEKNSPVMCFLYLTPRVALTALVPATHGTTKTVDIASNKSPSPETETAKTLILGGVLAFAKLDLPK